MSAETTPKPEALVVSTLLPYPPTGGAEKRTLRLLGAIQRAGANPYLLISEPAPADHVHELQGEGIRVEVAAGPPQGVLRRIGQHVARRPSPYVRPLAARIREHARTRGPAFVQIEHTVNGYYLPLLRGIPTVLSLHNVDSELLRTLALAEEPRSLARLRAWNRYHSMRVTERRAVKAADAVFCVSAEDTAAFDGIANRCLLVPNGVDDEFFDVPVQLPDADQVIFVGKFDYAPNALGVLRFLEEGWPRVVQARPGARLRLVGPGMSEEIVSIARTTPGIEIAGAVASVAAALSDAAVSVVPIWQGGGTRLKVLEALAAARPVAGTSLGVSGIGFQDDRHGLIADEPLALADAVVALLTDRERAATLARAGRDLAEEFRWDRALQPAEELYRDWIRRPGVPHSRASRAAEHRRSGTITGRG